MSKQESISGGLALSEFSLAPCSKEMQRKRRSDKVVCGKIQKKPR